MMKKLFLIFAMIFLWALSPMYADAETTGIVGTQDTALFIQIDPNGVGKIKETENLIGEEVANKLKASGHEILPIAETQQNLRIYLRENADTVTQRGSDEGVILKSQDFKALGNLVNTHYVVLIASRITSAEVKEGFWEDRKNLTVLTEVVVFDAQNGKYLMDEEFSNVGTTGGSYDTAYRRAIKEMLKQVVFSY